METMAMTVTIAGRSRSKAERRKHATNERHRSGNRNSAGNGSSSGVIELRLQVRSAELITHQNSTKSDQILLPRLMRLCFSVLMTRRCLMPPKAELDWNSP